MRSPRLAALAAFAFAVAFAAGFVTGRCGRARRDGGAPSAAAVRTIAVHAPAPGGGSDYHVLRVFRVRTDSGTEELGEVRPGNWIVATFPGEEPAGKGSVTYYAAP